MATKTLPPLPDIEKDTGGDTKQDYLPLYKVVMWDDNVTTMEFVVRILMRIFGKDLPTSEKLMYEVHYNGSAVADTMPLERAEFKVEQVHFAAAIEEFPFKCTIEPL
ncbi:MAG: ATP-dependent Clp protease adaptor ClpS [Nitrospinales bacterium]